MRIAHHVVRIAQFLAIIIGRCEARACTVPTLMRALSDSAARDPRNASALSAAFIAACNGTAGLSWNNYDALKYHQSTWHPGAPTGTSCSDMEILGGYLEGGRTVCQPKKLLSAQPCRVVSVGSNGESSFEAAVLAVAPHCSIDVVDGTLTGNREHLRHGLPAAVRFWPENFGPQSAARFGYRHVQVLKIDCEGCEYDSLMPWLQTVCTDQIYLELHTTNSGCGKTPSVACQRHIQRVHRLMSELEPWYAVYYKEPNVAYSGGLDSEFGLLRRLPCARGASHTRKVPRAINITSVA